MKNTEVKYDLVRLSTYAKMIGKSLSWVIKLAKEGKIKEVVIDGVHFIQIKVEWNKEG